jgi:signal transduction histidine kinase
MLQDGMAGKLSGAQLEYTNIVLGSVERMNELIDTLLNITRIEAGGLMVNPVDVELGNLAKALITESQPAAGKKSIVLASAIPTDLPTISSDTLLLREICSNLLSNAIKYTPDGGKVTLTLTQKNKDICCTVADTGYGIPTAQQKHIFTKFFRAENISRQDVSGTGLGLYLTKALVERLGGEIWFESKENTGTTFSFTLPLNSAA